MFSDKSPTTVVLYAILAVHKCLYYLFISEPVIEVKCRNYSRHFATNAEVDRYNNAAESIL